MVLYTLLDAENSFDLLGSIYTVIVWGVAVVKVDLADEALLGACSVGAPCQRNLFIGARSPDEQNQEGDDS